MLIERSFDTSIDLFDPNEIYTSDIESLIIKKLEEKYKNKCFQSMLITEIIRINERSHVVMSRSQLNGCASIDVNYQAKGIILQQGEILHGCEIIEIFENGIMARHKNAVVKIDITQNNQVSKILKKEQIIPIIVNQVKYTTNSAQISVMGIVYMPQVTIDVFYKITSGITMEETEKIGQILDEINMDEKSLDTNAKSFKFFQDLMYPYKTMQKFDKIPNYISNKFSAVPFELKDIINIKDGVVAYPSIDARQNRRFLWSSQEIVTDELIVETPLYPIISSILIQYKMYIMALTGFISTYSNPNDIQSLMTYWKICKNVKL